MRRGAPLTLLLAVAAVAAVVVAVLSLGTDSPAATVSTRVVTATKGVVQTTVSGSGSLAPSHQVDVDFATSGEITSVAVREGEHVAQGQVLGRLDDASQRVALAQAEATLQSARDDLSDAQDAADDDDTATTTTAAATVAPTLSFVDDPTPTTPATSPTTATAPTEPPARATTATTPAAPAPAATTAAAAPATSTPRASGSSSSGSSSAAGGSTMTVAAAQAAVDADVLAVQQAQTDLDATVLRAPITGTVATLTGAVGDQAGSSSGSTSSSGTAAAGAAGGASGAATGTSATTTSTSSSFATLVTLSRYTLSVSLSESDIGQVEVGQAATVTVDAASGREFAAHVTHVDLLSSSSSTGTSDAVSYPVELTLDQTGKSLRAGMTASADVIVDQQSGVVVPSQALSGSSLTVVGADGARSTTRVQTGAVGDASTIVTSGLAAGQRVVVTSRSAAAGAAARAAGGTGTTAAGATGALGGGAAGAGAAGGFGARAGGTGGFGAGAGGGFGGGRP